MRIGNDLFVKKRKEILIWVGERVHYLSGMCHVFQSLVDNKERVIFRLAGIRA